MKKTNTTALGNGSSLFNAHFVFNTLNIIQHYIILNDKKAALLSLNKFSKLFRQYLLLSKSGSTSIGQEITIIHLYLQLQVLRYTGKFTYQLICDKSLQPSKKIPVVQFAVIIDDLTESLLKKGEKEMHLCVRFKDDPDNVLLVLEAGDFIETGFSEPNAQKRYWQETGIYWRKHLDMFNSNDHYQVSYIEEKILPADDAQKSYMWRISIYIPFINR